MKQTNQTKQKSKLGFLGKCLHMQTEACVRKPNPTYVGFDLHMNTGFGLRMHAYDMRAQGCSKTLTQITKQKSKA